MNLNFKSLFWHLSFESLSFETLKLIFPIDIFLRDIISYPVIWNQLVVCFNFMIKAMFLN